MKIVFLVALAVLSFDGHNHVEPIHEMHHPRRGQVVRGAK